ncbi:MAG: hypothetical protein LUG18_02255 [Candidatus Azobacteroides sp.]|nr:hypothetical protein [Candidatus Azobacteroides sp.]
MKKKEYLVIILLLVSGLTCYAALPGSRESGIRNSGRAKAHSFSVSATGEDKGSLFSAESSREPFFWEKPVVFSSENIVKDDDSGLSAPPPGEDGYPQKMLPLSTNPWTLLFFSCLVFPWLLKKKRVEN